MFKELVEEYKHLFDFGPRNRFHIGCGEGWYNLISTMLYMIKTHEDSMEKIANLYPDKKLEYKPLKFLQIKEKFGCLRIYVDGGDFYTHGIIDTVENLSSKVCMISGNKGKLRYKKLNENNEVVPAWVTCLSDEEAAKAGYV